MSDILYLKIDKNVKITGRQVCLGEIASLCCSASEIENRVKTLRLPVQQIREPGRYVFSVLDVINVIQKEFPKLEISSLGEADFILTLEKRQPGAVQSWIKTGLVCLLSFFGAAFSIMAFNNDVGIRTLFGQLYETFTGKGSDGFTILELSYSVGVGLGILIFFHHFARSKGSTDPTPLQVQMRTYEDDVDTTVIEAKGRGKQTEKNRKH